MPDVQHLTLEGATWVDVNSRHGQTSLPDLLPDNYAIANSIRNLLLCPIGGRGCLFQPNYGASIMDWLQEPMDALTAQFMWIDIIQQIPKWEPRFALDIDQCSVSPILDDNPRYIITLVGFDRSLNKTFTVQLQEGVFLG